MTSTIEEVKQFWESNPLFSGESQYEVGTPEFFQEHRQVYVDDVFAGRFPENDLIPLFQEGAKVLDLGCGAGFWTTEILRRREGVKVWAGDLTKAAIDLTAKRLSLQGLDADLSIQNAERMDFPDYFFDHVNCQGVLHHTPRPDLAIEEIARVLKRKGTANISLYYRNVFLRNWHLLRPLGTLMAKFGAALKGRGREKIFEEKDVDALTRLYDGEDNPIGTSYDMEGCKALVGAHFDIGKSFLFFFPARSLPFSLPKKMHRFMSKNFGFMVHLHLVKKG